MAKVKPTKDAFDRADLCRGGASFNCKRISETAGEESRLLGPHEPKNPIYCRHCKTYMGCFWCAQRRVELVCLRCHDWACEEGEREHGKMIQRPVAAGKIRGLIDNLRSLPKSVPGIGSGDIQAEHDFWNVDNMIAAKARDKEM